MNPTILLSEGFERAVSHLRQALGQHESVVVGALERFEMIWANQVQPELQALNTNLVALIAAHEANQKEIPGMVVCPACGRNAQHGKATYHERQEGHGHYDCPPTATPIGPHVHRRCTCGYAFVTGMFQS